jgi:hypothetical protein
MILKRLSINLMECLDRWIACTPIGKIVRLHGRAPTKARKKPSIVLDAISDYYQLVVLACSLWLCGNNEWHFHLNFGFVSLFGNIT